jgi:hypothetical protein
MGKMSAQQAAVQLRRRSGAAGPHDGRKPRGAVKRSAIREASE